MTFLERDFPHRFRSHYQGEINPKDRSLVEGTHDLTTAPEDGGGALVSVAPHRTAMLPRLGLLTSFDDDLGRRVDFIRAADTVAPDWPAAGFIRRSILALA